MIYSDFVARVNTGLLQNYGTLMVDDDHIYFTISNMLKYIYSYKVWKWAIVREELTATGNELTMTNNAAYVIAVKNDGEEYKEYQMPFEPTDDEVEGGKYYYHNKNKLTVTEDGDYVVWYLKIPDTVTSSNSDATIDLPEEYISILYFLCMWNLYPYNLENGASLANNFKSQFVDKMFEEYDRTYSLGASPKTVQWKSIYNV